MRTKIDIKETERELKRLLSRENDSKIRDKLQTLLWLKTKKLYTVTQIANLFGCHRTTVQRWLNQYKKDGIQGILTHKKSTGRPKIIPENIVRKLEEELKDELGFSSYQEVQKWLIVFHDLDVKYRTIHELVRYRLKGKLKVPRPISIKQNELEREAFKKN